VIVTHTRWHPDDLIGRIRASADFEDWQHINLPAIAEANDLLGRTPGEPLLPWKFSAVQLDKLRRRLGEYSWVSLYQGQPRPKGGKLFGPVHHYRELPTTPLTFAYGVDMAYTAKKKADYSVCVFMAKTQNERFEDVYYLLHVDRKQVQAPAFGKLLRARLDHHPAPIYWRAVGPEKGSADLMADLLDVPFQVLAPGGDKFVNAQPLAAAWNDGRVLLPLSAPWLQDFVKEVSDFTGVNDPEDDQVDAAGNAFAGLFDGVELDLDSDMDQYLPRLSL
jgi:predicted phage terminase large subunit-like protein